MKSGIYRIINVLNNKMYIGSSEDLNERKINHFSMLRRKVHHSIHLQRAYDKLKDKKNLIFKIIEYCEKDALLDRENYYLNLYCKSQDYINGINKDFLKLSYNILPFAQKGFSGKHRPETIAKLKLCHPFRKNISIYDINGNFIETLSSAFEVYDKYKISRSSVLKLCKTKRYISLKQDILIGFEEDLDFIKFIESSEKPIKYKYWNEGKKYTSDESKNMGLKINCMNLETNELLQFNSQRDACRFFDLQPCTINRCLKNNKPYRKKLLFNYEDIV